MAVTELPEIDHVSQERHPPSFGRRVFRTIGRFAAVLALGALCGGGWYLAKKGFGRTTRQKVVEELHKRGVEASIRRLTLDPFLGLVARGVRIYDYRNRDYTIAEISRIALDVNYSALLHHQPFLNALDVRNARVTLPLPANAPPGSPHPQVRNLNAHIYFPPEQIYVSQAEGNFGGLQISATGQLIRRENYKSSRELTEAERQQRLQLVQEIFNQLSTLKARVRPRLQVKFVGDVAQLENAHVEASLHADQLQHGSYEVHNVAVAAEFSDQALTLTQCEWQDRLGKFAGSGVWRRAADAVEFEARSSIDLRAVLESLGLGRFLADFEFPTAPRVDVTGTARLTEPRQWQALGHIQCDRFFYRGVSFEGASAEFSSDGARHLVRDLRVRHESGELTGRLLDEPGDFRLDATSTIDGNALRGFAPADMRDFVNEWDWPHSPTVELAIRGPSRDPASWTGHGKLLFDRGRFRKVAFNSASADVHFGDGSVTYDNFRVVRDEGSATGAFTYDFKRHETRISNVHSTVRPAEAIFWIDPTMANAVTPYKFHRPPTVTVNGLYQFRGGKNTRLEIVVDAPGGLDYVFLGKTLPFDRAAAKLVFTDDRLQILDINSAILGGTARGSVDLSLARNDKRYHAQMTVAQANFPALTDLYFKYKTVGGLLDGRFDWTGNGDSARTIVGKGNVVVRNGNVLAIPIFGPLSGLLNTIFAGSTGYSVARDATCTFTMRDGVIHTPDLYVAAKIFSLRGEGDIHALENQLDMTVRVAPEGAAVLLTPLYKIFEYKGEGSLSNPNWHAKNF